MRKHWKEKKVKEKKKRKRGIDLNPHSQRF